jgi:hypothetical protein
LDGELDQVFPHTMSQDLDTYHSKSPVIIGKGFGDEFEGLIDDVKLYSRALSQAEIQAEYTRAGCGDPDGNDIVNILDVTYLINYLYKEGPPPVLDRSADANAAGNIKIRAVTHIINYLYRNGPPPVCR